MDPHGRLCHEAVAALTGAAGCQADDPLLAAERRALVTSHSALLDAVSRT